MTEFAALVDTLNCILFFQFCFCFSLGLWYV